MSRRPPLASLFALSVVLACIVNLVAIHFLTSEPRQVIQAVVNDAATKGVTTSITQPKVPLPDAIAQSNVGAVKQHMLWCLKHGGCDLDGDLRLAASAKDPTVAQVLVTAGADVNGANEEQETPLHETAATGRVAVAQVLLKAGANVNAADADGSTPLHTAAAWGHVELTRLLLASGASPNITDGHGDTPLHLVASRPVPPLAVYADVTRLLLERGAQVDLRDTSGATPLQLAQASSSRLSLDGNLKATGDAKEVERLLRAHTKKD